MSYSNVTDNQLWGYAPTIQYSVNINPSESDWGWIPNSPVIGTDSYMFIGGIDSQVQSLDLDDKNIAVLLQSQSPNGWLF